MSRTAATLLLLALSVAAPAAARPLVELAVIDRETGQHLPQAHHRGQRWIAGTPGHRYSVRLTNTSGERVLVVLSVDGVNAVTGDVASPSQGGYVLAPWQSTEVAGWRKSYDDVAQFMFTHLDDSYAARTGRPDHVGVIGIAVFEEARALAMPYPYPSAQAGSDASSAVARSAAAPPSAPPVAERSRAPAAAAQARSARRETGQLKSRAHAEDHSTQHLGTGHGARVWSPVAHTGFERATTYPVQLAELRYDSRETLVARGILPRVYHYPRPRAFPAGFVADPPRR